MTLKVFVDAHVFDGEFQGSRTYLEEIYDNILKRNKDITILFGANNKSNLSRLLKHNNAVHVQYKTTNALARIYLEIPWIINKYSCECAHFQYVIPLFRSKKCRYIVTIHDILFNDFPEEFTWLYRVKRNILFGHAALHADKVLTVSNYSKKRISKAYGINEAEIEITPNGVGGSYFDFPFSKEQSRLYIEAKYHVRDFILYVSRIEPRKNQNLLLNIYKQCELWMKDIDLVFVGKNSMHCSFIDDMNQLSKVHKPRIHWFEQVESDDLMHFYNATRLFVYLSKAEGFGIPPLEAAAMGANVICSNATAMQDFSFFYPNHCDVSNTKLVSDLVFNNISQRNESQAKQQSIASHIRGNYNWEKSALLLESIFLNFRKN
jgi:glycosyltransferase involved in cell wall biosynthesis